MSGRVGPQCPGAFEGGPGFLSEIDHVLGVIGAAHWVENFGTGADPQRQNASIKWQFWGRKSRSEREAERPLRVGLSRWLGVEGGR